MKEIIAAGLTDCGLKRKINQDSLLIKTGKFDQDVVGLFIVADGVGGLDSGEEASGVVVSSFEDWWNIRMQTIISETCDSFGKMDAFQAEFSRLIIDIHAELVERSAKKKIQSGTTLTMFFILNGDYCIYNIGDSRVYQSSIFRLKQVTQDQNLSTREYLSKEITHFQWKHYKGKDPLLQCIGVGQEVIPDIIRGRIKKGSKIFLCSDGVYRFLSNWILQKIVRSASRKTPEKALIAIRDEVYKNGAEDNLTGILIHCII